MLDYQFSDNSMVDTYNICEFYFSTSPVVEVWYLGNMPDNPNPQYNYHPAVEDIPKVNLEYNSPLVDGVFPEKGCFMVQTLDSGDEGRPDTVLNKIFIPVGCTRVILRRTTDGATCIITIPTNDSRYATLVTFYSGENADISPEVKYHGANHDESYSGFSIRPHELQVNGSELFQRFHDMYEVGRSTYISNIGIQVPEYSGFSLARNFSKFYIGGQVK